jgi:hypothetical protein
VRTIKDFVRGDGPEIQPGYMRGDSWVQTVGPHSDCDRKIVALGPGYGRDRQGRAGDGLLVRCGGCLLSWVIR